MKPTSNKTAKLGIFEVVEPMIDLIVLLSTISNFI